MKTLEELRERVSRLEGPDRETDFMLYQDVLPAKHQIAWIAYNVDDPWTHTPAPSFTASIEAALALVDRVLPGRWWQTLSRAMLAARSSVDKLPIAILLALLDALISEKAKAEEPA